MPKHSNSVEYAQIKTATTISKLTNNLLLCPNQLIKYFDHYLNKKWQNHFIRWCDYYLNEKNAETISADGQIIIWIKKTETSSSGSQIDINCISIWSWPVEQAAFDETSAAGILKCNG